MLAQAREVARVAAGGSLSCSLLWQRTHSRLFATSSGQLSLIKQLRDQSGAPISDVKKALEETGWNLGMVFSLFAFNASRGKLPLICPDVSAEKASEELRKKGLTAASKKASRSATEGLIGLATSESCAAIVEINSETDFVARNDLFRSVVSKAAETLLQSDISCDGAEIDADKLAGLVMNGGQSLHDAVQEVAGSVRENVKLRRGFLVRSKTSQNSSVIGTYLHASSGPNVGRIASAVLFELKERELNELEQEHAKMLEDVAHKVAMHVVGSVPKYLDRKQVPQEDVEKEKAILLEQASKSGKPKNIVERMVEGRLNKFYQDTCLVEQPFVMEEKKKVEDVVNDLATKIGVEIHLADFKRVQLGEGLEALEKDFAAEVSETIASTSR